MRVLLSVLMVMMAWAGTARAAEDSQIVAVFGHGSATAAPDMATFSVSVTTQAAKVTDAMDQAAARSRAVLDALRRAGVKDADVQTGQINLHPLYERTAPQPGGQAAPPRVVGHRATLGQTVRVRDLVNLGSILQAVTASGAGGLGGLSFAHSDPSALKDLAHKAAMENAQRTAQVLARAAGRGVGKVISISEEAVGGAPRPMMAMRAESAGVPVAAGELSVAVRVRVVYQLTAP